MSQVEETKVFQLDFTKLDRLAGKGMGVIPVAVQNADTREVVLVAYVNETALRETIRTRTVTFWSTSRNKLHVKGATDGQKYDLVEVFVNCEQNSLLFVARPRAGGICHTRNRAGQPRNCFYRRLRLDTLELENLNP